MTYVDGFVIPVPAGKKQAYQEMADERMKMDDNAKMPFDMQRMFFGGFTTIVDA